MCTPYNGLLEKLITRTYPKSTACYPQPIPLNLVSFYVLKHTDFYFTRTESLTGNFTEKYAKKLVFPTFIYIPYDAYVIHLNKALSALSFLVSFPDCFFFLFVWGREKGSGWISYTFLCSRIYNFWGSLINVDEWPVNEATI